MNSEQLNAIKERAEKATPGEWKARGLNVPDYARVEVDINDYESKVIVKSTNNSDIKFIAHAREDIPQLVAEVERLRRIISDIQLFSDIETAVSELAKEALGE